MSFKFKIMNLQNLGVQEMNVNELLSVDGGGFWDTVADAVISYVVEHVLDAVVDQTVEHMNNGAGYGGPMDTLGKL